MAPRALARIDATGLDGAPPHSTMADLLQMFKWKRNKPRSPGTDGPRSTIDEGVTESVDALKGRADAYLRAGQLDLAATGYMEVLKRDDSHANALINLGFVLKEQGRIAEASAPLERAVTVAPGDPDGHYLLGTVRQAQSRLADAVSHIERAIALRPQFEEAYRDLTMILFQVGRAADAGRCCDRGLALFPDSAELHLYRCDLDLHAGDLNRALASCRRAVALRPDLLPARLTLSRLLLDASLTEEALDSYREEIKLAPASAGSHYQAGVALSMLGRFEEAATEFRLAIGLMPDLAAAYHGLSGAYIGEQSYAKAQEASETAVALAPDNPGFRLDLGLVLLRRGFLDAALASFGRTIELDTNNVRARWARVMVHAPAFADSLEFSENERARFITALAEFRQWWEASDADGSQFVGTLQPFYLTYHEQDNVELLRPYGSLCAGAMQRWYDRQRFSAQPRVNDNRVRIAFVSADIRMHSVWIALIKGWLENLDRARFEVGVFCLNSQQDEVTEWARLHTDFFVTGPKSLHQWVEAIHAENPSVLIYPAVGLEEVTMQLASLRLAATQMNAWGHPDTSGLPTMDYYLSAECFEPVGAQAFYSETLVALPGLGNPYEALKVPSIDPDFQRLGLDPNRTILICPGSPFKYQPNYDHVFIEIARRLPDAQFVFFTAVPPEISELLRGRLARAFAERGMEFDHHGRFLPWQTFFEYHGLLKRADLFLDSIGFSGYNNAIQALECGLPLVTREGRFMRGRLASGILRRIGLTELIAQHEVEYVELVVRLATDKAYLQRVRDEIVRNRAVLFNDRSAIEAFENLLAPKAA